MEFSFSKTVLSAWWESTAASSSTTCRSSRPEVFCRPTFFHRTPLVVASKHEIQAPTLTAGREQEEEFRGSPDNENTNEEEKNSAKQTNKQKISRGWIRYWIICWPGPVIWKTSLNGFKDYSNKKVTCNNISTSL